MTQFALCTASATCEVDDVELRAVTGEQSTLQQAAAELFHETDTVCVPFLKSGDEISLLFNDAHDKVFNGGEFGSSKLSRILTELLGCSESLALWWGNDWRDLPTYESPEEFVNEVVRQLREPIGDVYVRWSRSR